MRNIAYHAEVRDFYLEEAKKEKPAPHAATRRTGSAAAEERVGAEPRTGERTPPKPEQSSHDKLAEMHDDVVKQLTAVLEATPVFDALVIPGFPRRSTGADLRPSAGVSGNFVI